MLLFPFEIPSERSSGEKKTLLAQLCIIKVESIPPVLAYKHNNVCEMRMAAHCGIVQNHHYNTNTSKTTALISHINTGWKCVASTCSPESLITTNTIFLLSACVETHLFALDSVSLELKVQFPQSVNIFHYPEVSKEGKYLWFYLPAVWGSCSTRTVDVNGSQLR